MEVDVPNLSAELRIPFLTEREADIAFGSLSVDKEPKRGGCRKTLTVDRNFLIINFTAAEARMLRVGVNSFLDLLTLVMQTMQQFGPPVALTTENT
ncbi:EKC/KEOPS complex subunit LAGE3-like [Tubulanus polymorphus]|uniref:EKC/KEOPS complex subunit LAGE3-like n=1 Tax=Tubulanus polymorphus TaxID=672921 RepID=UPI003DA4A0BD